MFMAETSHIRVLLVVDEEILVEFLSKRLLKAGFTVRAANSGGTALEIVKDAHFDVAVVDLKMPGMDGVETQMKLREMQPLLQCIVLTGHGSVESALESGHMGAFKYLLKPIDYEELVETIKKAFEKKTALQNEKLQELIDEVSTSGLGARGIKAAIEKLRKTYGFD